MLYRMVNYIASNTRNRMNKNLGRINNGYNRVATAWDRRSDKSKEILERQLDSIEAGFVVGVIIYLPLAFIEFKLERGKHLSEGFLAIFSYETFAYLIISAMYACAVGAFYEPAWKATKTIHDSILWGIPFLWAIALVSYLALSFQGQAEIYFQGFAVSSFIVFISMLGFIVFVPKIYERIKNVVASSGNEIIINWKSCKREEILKSIQDAFFNRRVLMVKKPAFSYLCFLPVPLWHI